MGKLIFLEFSRKFLRGAPLVFSMRPCIENLGWGAVVKSNGVLAQRLLWPWKTAARLQSPPALEESSKSLTNAVKLYLLTALNWLNSLIGPGGLRLVVSRLFVVSVFMGEVGKKYSHLDVGNLFGRSHTEHWWRCSYNNNKLSTSCTILKYVTFSKHLQF